MGWLALCNHQGCSGEGRQEGLQQMLFTFYLMGYIKYVEAVTYIYVTDT